MAGFGEKLRLERERQGYTLAQVSRETKIRQHYLSALEEEEFDSLPARVYSIGFVASYARFLKMDTDRLVSEFKHLAFANQPIDLPTPEPSPGRIFGFPVGNVLAAVIFLAITLWLGNYVADFITQRSINPPSQVQQVTPPTAPVPPDVGPTQPAAEQLTLAIQATQPSWVQITVDGAVQYAGTLAAGENQSFTGKEKIDLRTGNAGGIELYLNGVAFQSPGAVGQVAEHSFTRVDTSTETAAVPGPVPNLDAPAALNLVIQAQQRSWVQVEADGESVFAKTMAEGEIQAFNASRRIELRTGNAGGISLTLNGQPVQSLGASGQIAEKEFRSDSRGE